MEAAAQLYVTQLKESRAREEKRREERRRRRNEYMQLLQRDSEVRTRLSVQADVRRHLFRPSEVETQMFESVLHTAKWWGALCDHSIDRRLAYERALQMKQMHRSKYLDSVLGREHHELLNVVDLDEQRWAMVKEQFHAHERVMKQLAVSGAVRSILSASNDCIDFLHEYCLEDSKNSFLGQCALREVIHNAVRVPTPQVASRPTSEASRPCYSNGKTPDVFQRVFGGSPFLLTSPHFCELVDLLYRRCSGGDAFLCSFDVSGVPVFVVEGPKYSGKSMLTQHMETALGFRCFSDRQLIQTALDAATACGGSDGQEDCPRNSLWAAVGQRVREALYSGGAVDVATVAELFQLQLHDVQEGGACSGIVFDGVTNCVDEYKAVQHSLLPQMEPPFAALHAVWCPEKTELETRLGSAVSGGGCASEENSNAEAQSLWNVRKAVAEEITHKKEPRAKVGKKGADATAVPPPTLPTVEDVEPLIALERTFVERARDQLRAYTGIFSGIIHIQCDPKEIFKRFAGLRVDRETGEEYHMAYHPPPPDRVPFLVSLNRTQAYTAHLHDVIFHQQQHWESLQRWLRKQPAILANVHEVNGEDTVEELQREASNAITRALEKFASGRQLHESIGAAEERIQQLKGAHERQKLAREEERLRLVAIYTEKGVPLPPELEPPVDPDCFYDVPSNLPEALLTVTKLMTDHYCRVYEWAWGNLGDMVRLLLEYRNMSRAHLQRFWEQPDDKQEVLDRFVAQLNAVPDAHRSKITCKEELHCYVDELVDCLYGVVDFKQRDCLALVDCVTRREAFLDGWEANVCNVGICMAHAEVERFTAVANLTLHYFCAILDEPFMVEEIEADVTFIRPTADPSSGEPSSAGRAGKDRKPPVSRKGHVRPPEEGGERLVEEVFAEVLSRLSGGITTFTEKFKASADIKNMKKMTTSNTAKAAAIAAKCVPVLESELASTLGRIRCVRDFILDVSRQGDGYMTNVRAGMQNEAREMFVTQAAAVNAAIYVLRSHIEMEKRAPALHLGCGTFAVLTPAAEFPDSSLQSRTEQKQRSFITDVPLYSQLSAPALHVHATLTAVRLMEIIRTFRGLAPNYQLARDDFVLVVTEDDFGGAATSGHILSDVGEVFSTFDSSNCGVIDWRECVVHLLFWCAPPPRTASEKRHSESFYTPEITLEDLLDLRGNLCSSAGTVSQEEFCNAQFFMSKYLTEERLEAYVHVLWATFADPSTDTLDPLQMLWFLCADAQPIRGAQKAFYVLATHESGRLSTDDVDRIFHVKATNNRAVRLDDPFSRSNLQLLFGDAETLSFEEMCACVMGRKMLNCVDMFHRKRFITEVA